MQRSIVVSCAMLLAMGATAPAASADWLLTGFVAPIFSVKTSENLDFGVPEENYDSSVGFGFNLASAFPTRGNLGFELDVAWYPDALKGSDQFSDETVDLFASKLMTINTNFFYSPATPRVRPYFSVGPTFSYRSDADEAVIEIPSGWAVGINAGGGIMAFFNPRFGARVDFRYFRHFGDFFAITTDEVNQTGWQDLQFFRVFFGGTVVL